MQAHERRWRPDGALDLRRTLAPLQHGPRDPTCSSDRDGAFWRATLTPEGPATLCLQQEGEEVHGQAWGPGAAWVLDGLPELCGTAWEPALDHPLLQQAHRRHPGVRIPRTRRVWESLVPAVLEQKVTGKEAVAAFATLVRRYGGPAPGPAPAMLRVPPPPEVWLRIPSWEWHRAGVDPRRMRAVLAAARVAPRLEESVTMAPAEALRRLTAVPGVGEWTAAEVAIRALGDTDAVSVGDFHLPGVVGWALVGGPLDDAGMLEVLEPYRPHRALVVRLIELAGPGKPRFGPRLSIQDHRGH